MGGSKLAWSSFDFLNETEFEKILLRKDILKKYLIYNAKKSLNIYRKYNRYADVLLIEKNFKYWCVGEVEVSKHSFKNHIFPQLIEIFSLMQQNIDLIRKNYLQIDNISANKNITDLIKYNEPFLVLIIDKIPSNLLNIIPLLNSFCNVKTILRSRDESENYMYRIDDYYMDSIVNNSSNCYVNDNVLIIDHPNLLGLNVIQSNFITFKGQEIRIQEQFNKINGVNRLFWILEKKVTNGKYKIQLNNNKLILTK